VKTFDLNEAAAFLHMHPEEVRTRARRGSPHTIHFTCEELY
jgi:hypothetical protein